MAYVVDKWTFRDSSEYEYKFAGNYGAKGETRAEKKKVSPEQVEKQNQRNREKRMRRLIKANFVSGDIWTTLKYPKGTRKDPKEIKKDIQNFLKRLGREYKKKEAELKYIYRMEIGKNGGAHIHMILNRIDGIDEVIQRQWKEGRVNYESLYEDGGYEDLAAYITKKPEEGTKEYKQLSFFPEEERKDFVKYSTSRNLIRPVPERKEYKRRTLRKMVEEGIKPTPGFYVEKKSIMYGVNPYTGMGYLHYTEVRIKPQEEFT